MDTFLYLFFGFLDVMVNLALVYKLYRFPFWEYYKEFLIIGITLSVASYVVRLVIGMPEIDMICQYILYIIFFRYLIKIKLYYAFPMAAVGYLAYAVIQFSLYPVLLWTGLVNEADVTSTNGLGVYAIQLCSELTGYLIAFLMYRFGLGFSHITRPPHGMSIKIRDKQYNWQIAANVLGSLVVVFIMYWIFNHISYLFVILPSSLLALSSLVFLSYRKDYDYD